MTIIESIVLGIVQGLTEFLPVSSSGHLRLTEEILGIEVESNLSLIIALHLATVLSTIIVFRKDIRRIANGVVQRDQKQVRYLGLLLISVVPVVLARIILGRENLEKFYENATLVGIGLIVTSVLLTLTTLFSLSKRSHKLTSLNAIEMGAMQAVSIIPGISRSGATISAGVMTGVDKKETARFAFLMAIFPILGGATLDFFEMIDDGSVGENLTIELGVAFLVALIVGILAAKIMINLVVRNLLIVFAVYTLVVGILTLVFL